MTEGVNDRIINQPSFIFFKILTSEMTEFFEKYLVESENQVENIEFYLDLVDDSPILEQSL